MTRGPRRRLWRVWGGLLLALLVGVPGGAAPRNPEKAREHFTNLPLVNQDGQEVRFYRDCLAGKVVLISGFYINCDTICPLQNTVLSRLQKNLGERFGKEVFFVSITVDPKRDRLEDVKEYAKVWAPRPGWTFLTGKVENVDWVNYKLGQYKEDPETHEGVFLLGNLKSGRWLKAPPQSPAEALEGLLENLLDDNPKVGG